MNSVHNILKGKYEWKTTLCRPKHRWKYNIVKMDLKEAAVLSTVWCR